MTDRTNHCDHCRYGDHSQRYEVCACCRSHRPLLGTRESETTR